MTRVTPALALAIVLAAAARGEAAGQCPAPGRCPHLAAGDTGCGPRYWGAVHEDCRPADPCDTCGRWRDCNGVAGPPEKLAPWQLPPGRGFLSGADVGYRGAPCGRCGACGPRIVPVF